LPSRLYLQQLGAARLHLDTLLSNTTATLDLLSEISASFKAVESQTSAFQQQSEGLLQEQRQTEIAAEGIRNNLKYYDPLERTTRRLNAPGAGSIARSRDFSEMLVQLDECIDYMHTHPEQKEAETYRSRYRLLLTRALTLVRSQFVGSVRETSAEVAKRIADKQLNDTTMSALLYAKFRVGAAEMKELGLEIQKRANPPADAEPGTEGEYQSLMDELHTSFAASRGRLVIPLVRTKLAEIAQAPSTSKDLVAFARSSISYIRGICLDEFELWSEWFHGQRGLYDFLEAICEPLYDHLRPRVIHELKLPKLCQLCTLLQTRYMSDGEDEYEPPDLNELDFTQLIQSALEDTQSRIVFRTQAILRDEIENFKPKPSDLDYPNLLKSKKAPTSGRKSSQPTNHLPEPADDLHSRIPAQERWPFPNGTTIGNLSTPYPTLTRAISLLSLIYRLLNPRIFDDLAHRIVHATTLSLIQASNLLLKTPPPNKPKTTADAPSDATANAHLFLLNHLLLLKSQIIAFDIEFSPQPEVTFDFSNLTNTFYELQAERGGLFNPLNLVRLVGRGRDLLPRVVENMLDAKVDLDGRLRKVISDFTGWEAEKMTAPIKAKGVNAEEKAGRAVAEMRKVVEREVPLLRRRLEVWLDDGRTRETLIMAVREAAVQGYEEFWASMKTGNGPKAKSRVKGKGREDDVWDVDAFVEWTDSVFGVGVTAHQEEGDENLTGQSPRSSRNGSM
jgi:conserved oligomeric Golgi complex subunit 3